MCLNWIVHVLYASPQRQGEEDNSGNTIPITKRTQRVYARGLHSQDTSSYAEDEEKRNEIFVVNSNKCELSH